MTKFRIKQTGPNAFYVQRKIRFLFWTYWQTEYEGVEMYACDIRFDSKVQAQRYIDGLSVYPKIISAT